MVYFSKIIIKLQEVIRSKIKKGQNPTRSLQNYVTRVQILTDNIQFEGILNALSRQSVVVRLAFNLHAVVLRHRRKLQGTAHPRVVHCIYYLKITFWVSSHVYDFIYIYSIILNRVKISIFMFWIFVMDENCLLGEYYITTSTNISHKEQKVHLNTDFVCCLALVSSFVCVWNLIMFQTKLICIMKKSVTKSKIFGQIN